MQQLLKFVTCRLNTGRPHAHHQELNNCSSSFWFYRWSVEIVLLVVVGPARPGPTATNSTAITKLRAVKQRLLLQWL
jgi:hypothetical protein